MIQLPFATEAFSLPTDYTDFPARLVRLPGTQTLVHLIDFEPYQRLQQGRDMALFCVSLTEKLRLQGWRVVHLWEDVWQNRPDVVLSRLRALMGQSVRMPGRLTKARRIDRATANNFLTANHLQVSLTGKYRYGLFLPARYFRVLPPDFAPILSPENQTELLVAVATFAHPRVFARDTGPHRSFELLRFANLLNTTVVGGLDKLLTAFATDHAPEPGTTTDLMTYADRDWSDGQSYERLGFSQITHTEPMPFWVRPGEWVRYPTNRPPDDLADYVTVWNAGSLKFVR
jgi:hypothetical protein